MVKLSGYLNKHVYVMKSFKLAKVVDASTAEIIAEATSFMEGTMQ